MDLVLASASAVRVAVVPMGNLATQQSNSLNLQANK
jgi:hypothetical protein